MNSATAVQSAPSLVSLKSAAATALPKSSKTIDTVVDVGSPKELNVSRSRMSAARKITMISAKENICG